MATETGPSVRIVASCEGCLAHDRSLEDCPIRMAPDGTPVHTGTACPHHGLYARALFNALKGAPKVCEEVADERCMMFLASSGGLVGRVYRAESQWWGAGRAANADTPAEARAACIAALKADGWLVAEVAR